MCYIGADAFKRSAAQFPTEPCPREVPGCLVARAMTVLAFYRRLSLNRMLMPSSEARHSFLPNRALERFWDALWLELWPFLFFILETCGSVCWRAQSFWTIYCWGHPMPVPCLRPSSALLRVATLGSPFWISLPSTRNWGLGIVGSRLKYSWIILKSILLHPTRDGYPGVTFS